MNRILFQKKHRKTTAVSQTIILMWIDKGGSVQGIRTIKSECSEGYRLRIEWTDYKGTCILWIFSSYLWSFATRKAFSADHLFHKYETIGKKAENEIVKNESKHLTNSYSYDLSQDQSKRIYGT